MGRRGFMGGAISALARELAGTVRTVPNTGAVAQAGRLIEAPIAPVPTAPPAPTAMPMQAPPPLAALPSVPRTAPELSVARPDAGFAGMFSRTGQMGRGSMTERPQWNGMQRNDPFSTPEPPGMGGSWGSTSTVGGAWSTLDSMNSYIEAAARSTGVPPNLIKAMLAREGGFGNDKWVADLRGEQVYAFNGIFRSTAESYGIDFDRMTQDDAYAVWAMGRVLQGIKENNPELGSWDNVAKYYFAGPNWTNPGWGDETGQNTVDNYAYGPSGVVTRWKWLDQQSGSTGNYGGSWGGDWSNFGSDARVHDWGEFGVDSDNGYYGYGTQYGLNGRQHTGLDIVGQWNATYYAPVSGTVTCAGTGNGAGADGGGCAAFGTMDGRGGAGRIELQLDNGAVLIFGHSQGSFVRPGQRINAGDALGTIGWANSDHIHLEARVRDPSTPSGWRIVDPREVLGGSWGGGGNWGGGQQQETGWRRWLI